MAQPHVCKNAGRGFPFRRRPDEERPSGKGTLSKKRLLAVAGVAAAGALYIVICRWTGWGIPCLFHRITGLYCPGCGVSRMLLSMATLDFAAAFRWNPLLFVLSPFAAVYLLYGLYAYLFQKENVLLRRTPGIVWILLIVLLVGFGVLRNLPGCAFLAPPR